MNPDPFSTNDRPMSYKDAITVATILLLVTVFTVFLPTHGYAVYVENPEQFLFELVAFIGAQWTTVFASMLGLTAYAKYQESRGG